MNSNMSLLLAVFVALFGSSTIAFSPLSTASRSRRVWGVGISSSSSVRMAGPSILERESVKVGGGPAILERPETLKRTTTRRSDDPTRERKGMGGEAWEVRIYNDGLNTREHVARSLVQVTGISEMDAYQTMMQAHQNGIAVVGRWVYEVAEMYHDALRQNGIVCDIVPVEED